MILNFFRVINSILMRRKNPVFTLMYKSQKKILNKFEISDNLILMSFFQYKCQKKLNSYAVNLLYDVVSIPICLYYIFRIIILFPKKYSEEEVEILLYSSNLHSKLIPSKYQKNSKALSEYNIENFYLTSEDKTFLIAMFLGNFYRPYFLSKNIINSLKIMSAINQINPNVLINSVEYSFSSSVLTQICRYKKVKHVNVMHGEKLFFIRDAFVCFDEMIVWDRHYTNLFNELKCSVSVFTVLDYNIVISENRSNIEFDFVYFLAAENNKKLRKINKNFVKLRNKGFNVAIRPHPRYSNISKVDKIFSSIKVIKPKNETAKQTILKTKKVVALYSTVLNEAMAMDKIAIIDDVTSSKDFDKLKSLKYIIFSKKHELLSDYLN